MQLYVRDVVASVARPVRELKGFLRVHLSPGESRDVVFTLTDADLGLLDANLRRVLEPGTFHIMVGASSLDIRLQDGIEVR